MFYLDVIGGRKKQRSIIYEAIDFCLPHLFTERMINNLSVTVKLEKLDIFGYCMWEDDNVRPRDFIINLSKEMDDENIIKTLFHETTHMKQYVYNELRERYKKGHKLYWFDVDHSNTPYENQPWETEAIKYEESLYSIFINK
jgi:hypothetical protein